MKKTMVLLMVMCLAIPAAAQTTRPVQNGSPYDNGGQDGGYGGNRRNGQRRNQQYGDQGNQGNFRRNRRSYADAGPLGTFTPTTQPEMEQAEIPTPREMTGDYLVLLTRSIFSRDGSVQGVAPSRIDARPRIEATTIFNGATKTDGVFVADLENSESGQTTLVHVGTQIAQGRITKITLNSLDYQPAGGSPLHLSIGENLAGEQIYGTGSVSASLPAGVDMSGPNADILKKMMQRRQQELNGGK